MTFAPDNAAVWFEIPVRDLDAGMAFYSAVFGYEMQAQPGGPNLMAVLPTAGGKGVAGHLYPGKPAGDGTGPTVHLAVPGTLEEAMPRVTKAGGKVISDPIPLPMGRFAYATDPDGNSIGLFEPAA